MSLKFLLLISYMNDFAGNFFQFSWPLAGGGRYKLLKVDWLSPIHGP